MRSTTSTQALADDDDRQILDLRRASSVEVLRLATKLHNPAESTPSAAILPRGPKERHSSNRVLALPYAFMRTRQSSRALPKMPRKREWNTEKKTLQ